MVQRLVQLIRPMLPRLMVGLLVTCIGCFSGAAAAAPGRTWVAPQSASREVSLARIVSILEGRMPGHELSEKTKVKLLTLNDRQLRTAMSLAERIEEEDHGAVAETAFLLLTVLIILS